MNYIFRKSHKFVNFQSNFFLYKVHHSMNVGRLSHPWYPSKLPNALNITTLAAEVTHLNSQWWLTPGQAAAAKRATHFAVPSFKCSYKQRPSSSNADYRISCIQTVLQFCKLHCWSKHIVSWANWSAARITNSKLISYEPFKIWYKARLFLANLGSQLHYRESNLTAELPLKQFTEGNVN